MSNGKKEKQMIDSEISIKLLQHKNILEKNVNKIYIWETQLEWGYIWDWCRNLVEWKLSQIYENNFTNNLM